LLCCGKKESEPFLEQVPELHELLLPPAELHPLGRQLLLQPSHFAVPVLVTEGHNLLVFWMFSGIGSRLLGEFRIRIMMHNKVTADQIFYKKIWLISFRFFCAFSFLPVLDQDPQNQIEL
jgi:hypothetical protein